MSNLNKLIESFEATKQKFQTEATELLKEEFKSFFKDVPEIKVIKWTQYTPYFNDGDPCEFSVNEPTFSNADDADLVSAWGEYEGEDEGIFAFQGTWSLPGELKDKKDRIKELSEMLCSSAMEDVLLAAFDDHAIVTVTRAGIDSDEYEHD